MLNYEQIIIDELHKLQPYIASHGGRISFVKYEQDTVYVALEGACVDCPLSFYTVTYGIERAFKQVIPDIKKVVVVDQD